MDLEKLVLIIKFPIPRLVLIQKRRQVDADQITRRDIILVLWQSDLSTEVGQVNRTGVVV